tara:strand:- start:792 stop:1088 length:297 start_codon:yes stop_codon:yes gene_type:complete
LSVIKLVQICEHAKVSTNTERKFSLNEVYINPSHVTYVKEDPYTKRLLSQNILPEGLDNRQEFSKIYINHGDRGVELTIVGEPTSIIEKLGKKSILRG